MVISASMFDFPQYPILGPAESVMRFIRGETVWPENITEDKSRWDVWAVSKEMYDRWMILCPDQKVDANEADHRDAK